MTDPNWTPKEPKRPLQMKPGAFGAEYAIPKEQIEEAEDSAKVNKLIKDAEDGRYGKCNETNPNNSPDL